MLYDQKIHEIFEAQAAKCGDRTAVVDNSHLHVTYRELNCRADRLALLLKEKGVVPRSIVAVMIDRSIAMVEGVLGILKAGAAYLPVDPGHPAERIRRLLSDSRAVVLLRKSKEWECEVLHVLSVTPAETSPSDPAYILYTSGSTGNPKGVIVEHQSVVNLLYALYEAYPISPPDAYILKTSFYFDVSVTELFGWFMGGSRLIVLEKGGEKDPQTILDTVEKFGVTHINFVPAMFNAFTLRLETRGTGGIKSLKYIFQAGEALLAESVKRFRRLDTAVRLENLYGPTEGTVYVTGYSLSNWDGTGAIPIGKPLPNLQTVILDESDRPVNSGQPGELCVAGLGVARGYLNNPELTAEKFRILTPSNGSYFFYKTGDLARLLPDGNIEFLGRIDHQVKIRGVRIEPGEIESRLSAHRKIKDAVVIARENGHGDKYLCAYVTVKSDGDSSPVGDSELREYLLQVLPENMVPSFFVFLDQLPLTGSGKVDRKALPEPVFTRGARYQPPRDRTEEKLVEIWAAALGIEQTTLGIDHHFFNLGGHSLSGADVSFSVHKIFNVRLLLSQLFEMPTIRQLAAYIRGADKDRYLPLEKAEEKAYYSLSPAQKRLYVLYRVAPESTVYNISVLYELEGPPDIGRLEQAFRTLIARHESLRTSFMVVDRAPVQRIHEKVDFAIGHYKHVEFNPSTFIADHFMRPFDLSLAPLLRAAVIETSEGKWLLALDMHHIVSDGISIDVFQRELVQVYALRDLPPLRARYRDYSEWEFHERESGAFKRQEEYWLGEFSGELPVLSLPLDLPRPRRQVFDGNTIFTGLDEGNVREIYFSAKAANVTIYMFLLALFNILSTKLSGSEDIVVGTPVAGRKHVDLQEVVGMFVGTLALRNFPRGEKTFSGFLDEVKERTLAAFENQEYPFDELVRAVVSERDASRNPIFDCVFALETFETEIGGTSGLKLSRVAYAGNIAKFDLAFIIEEIRETLTLRLEYCTALFKPETVGRFAGYFKNILDGVLREPGKRLSEIEIISEEERRQILEVFNRTASDYPADKTVHKLFEEEAARKSDGIAVTMGLVSLTYRELNFLSDGTAARLSEKGVCPATIAAVSMNRSLELIIGLLGVLKAGAAYLPLDPGYPEERTRYMLADSGAGVLLEKIEINPNYRDGDNPRAASDPSSPAYVIYTSGSTGKPKGVIVEHRGVVRLVKNTNYIPLTGEDRLLLTGSISFDITTFEIWGSLLNGMRLYLTDAETVMDFEQLERFVVDNRISILHLVPQLMERATAENTGIFAGLKYFLVGGDMVRPGRINLLRRLYKNLEILHMYGPTENTTFSTFFSVREEYTNRIPIGTPISNSTVYIVDKAGHPVPPGIYGEILVGGDGVARGYLNNPDLTAEKFNWSNKSYRTYKTGDLARWRPDGVIEFSGRADRQVKVRGIRIEPGEIENRLLTHPLINEAVVLAREGGSGDKYLCAYVILKKEASVDEGTASGEIREYLSKQIPEAMIPSFFVFLERLPLTANGKLDRKALPEPGKGTGEKYTTPRDRTEERLVEIWAGALGIEKGTIGIDHNFFQLGGHSLNGAVAAAGIHKTFNVRLSLSELFETPTIRGLAASIKGMVKEQYRPLEKAETKSYYPLSSDQRRLYILSLVAPDSTVYNIPSVYKLEGTPDKKRLEKAIKVLIARHESLRTSFITANREFVQMIHGKVEFTLEQAATVDRFIRPFDLSCAPLIRAALVTMESGKLMLAVDMHHIISDGLSFEVFQRELTLEYNSRPLPPLGFQYRDYSEWQNRERGSDLFKQQAAYWLEEFSGDIPILSLPLDFPRPRHQGFEGKTIFVELEEGESRGIYELAKVEKVSLYMVLLSAYYILLAKLSGQEEIVVGTPSVGRMHLELQPVIGMFVKTLAMRNFPAVEKSFRSFLSEVKEKTLGAFENQEYPFEELVESVLKERDASRNPLFDCVFSLENLSVGTYGDGELRLTPVRFALDIAKFDLTFTMEEVGESLTLRVEYCTQLFNRETVERFAGYYRKILRAAVEDPAKKIKEIEIVSDEERRLILEEFNAVESKYPVDKTIHGLFEAAAERFPDHLAVHDRLSGHIAYGELNGISDRLSQQLIDGGTVAGDIVALIMEPSLEMITAIIAILKAGCAYLPLNPADPPDRKRYMMEDCGVRVVLTQKEIPIEKSIESSYIVLSPENNQKFFRGSRGVFLQKGPPGNIAYVIFTSGSTGNPKGVPITHSNMCPLLHWGYDEFGPGPGDRTVRNLSYYFDWSVWEIFITLTSGAGLFITDRAVLLDPRSHVDYIQRSGITILHITPTQFQSLARFSVDSERKLDTMKYLFIGAERLTFDLVELSYRIVSAGCRIFNMYGPTEATIISAALEIDKRDNDMYRRLSSVPIGKPSANARLMVLDKGLNLCPVRVEGELYIFGEGVSPGYLNNPQLTVERFNRSNRTYRTYNSYKTGDLVRWLPDGTIEFLDRVDFQVKVRGFRIEIGEIESRLLEHEKITEAVVVPVGRGGDKYLCAYFVSGEKLAVSGIREHLAVGLPDYMIPSVFIQVDKMPMNPNGKVDRKRLPAPEQYRPVSDTVYTAPYTEMEKLVGNAWKEVLQLERVGIDNRFFELGGNSLKAVQVNEMLRGYVGQDIPAVTLFRYPTVRKLARYLSGEEKEEEAPEPRGAGEHGAGTNDIAVIGIAGRFPGAGNIDEFWENLEKGIDSIAFFTDEELVEAGVDPVLLTDPNYVKARGYLDGAEYFDAGFFNYTPLEARLMDPQLRIFHECMWAALENASCNPDIYPGLIGVYAGAAPDISWMAEMLRRFESPSQQFDVLTLNSGFSFATRISYNFNLRGPAISLQTACSTSLAAVHLGCRALVGGECDIALAGGVAVSAESRSGYLFQRGMIGSSDGRTRAFDAKADGTIRGDGVGVVVLKRLRDALEERDHIYAVVKGTAINNDGSRKIGYTAPSVEGQADVIRAAHRTAGIDPHTITYIETHGAGTPLGDPIEIEGLKLAFTKPQKPNVFQGSRGPRGAWTLLKKPTWPPEASYCAVGAVKTNIGHLDNAAGIAGLIKTVLALVHRKIPPSLFFKTPNPAIEFDGSPFYVNARLTEWKTDGSPLRAGVSAFGIGGTNAHVVLEEAPPVQILKFDQAHRLIVLSARTQTALEVMTKNLAAHFRKHPGINLPDAAYTLQTGRKMFKYRGMTVCSDTSEPGKWRYGKVPEGDRPVVFMFPGFGAQYENMGRGLYEAEPLFRRETDRCNEILSDLLGENPGRLEVSQAEIFAFEYALAKLLLARGIAPDAMIGYSLGEYSAACISGVLSLEDALHLIVERSRLVGLTADGLMVNVPLSVGEVEPQLTGGLSIAVDNDASCLVAGPAAEVELFEKQMKERRLICTRLPFTKAIHSPTMEPVLSAFEKVVREVTLSEPGIPYCSNVTGDWIRGGEEADPGYWVTHLRRTVRFADGVKAILKRFPGAVLVEVGPGRDLMALVMRYIEKDPRFAAVNLVRHPRQEVADDRFLLERIGSLWLNGIHIDWENFYAGEKRHCVPLPGYPFEGRVYGIEKAGDRERVTPHTPPETETQKILTAVWEECLGIGEIGIDDDLFDLGADSLKALTVIARIHERLEVELPVTDIFNFPTAARLAAHIEGMAKSHYRSVEPAEDREYYPLSSAQTRLYFVQQIQKESVLYNIPVIFILEGEPDMERLERAFNEIIRRHEMFRTSFRLGADGPVQVIHPAVDFRIRRRASDVGETGILPIVKAFVKPYDLAVPPLFRMELVRLDNAKYLWLFDIHHILTDATGYAVFQRELSALYNGEELAPVKTQYRDFSIRQARMAESGELDAQMDYWLRVFSDGVPRLNFPTDHPRPAVPNFEGKFYDFRLPARDTAAFLAVGSAADVTLFVSLLAVLNVILFKYTGQEDIVVGIGIAGRSHADLWNVPGMFANMLPMRNRPRRDKTYWELLLEIKGAAFEAFANQDVQFEVLAQRLNLETGTPRNPLFDVCLSIENFEQPKFEMEGLSFTPYIYESGTSKFDLVVWANHVGDEIRFTLEYSTELFEPAAAETFAGHLLEVICQVGADKDARLTDIRISHRVSGPESYVPDIDFGF